VRMYECDSVAQAGAGFRMAGWKIQADLGAADRLRVDSEPRQM
jgi:hypothetical protein